MNKINFKVDEEKCIHCGLCVSDCVSNIIEFDQNKIPKIKPGCEKDCLKCQHCLAICPGGAISVLNKNPEDSEPVKSINPDDVLNLIKTRRSFRQFKKENLSPGVIEKLKDVLKYPPTGCNERALRFDIVDVINVMDKYREFCIKKLKKIVPVFSFLIPKKFSGYKQKILNGEDIIFRQAPHMLVASVRKDAPCADIDPIIALSYFELYAQSLGIATLWCGFALMALRGFSELKKSLNLPKNYKISYVILFGAPAVKYARAIQPENYEINSLGCIFGGA